MENLKSKIENWWGLSPSSSRSQSVGLWPTGSHREVPRLGFLAPDSQSASSIRTEAFRQGLRELGYVEGQNIVIDYRFGEGKRELFPNLAAELARLKVNILVSAGGNAVTRAAQQATNKIPIVMTNVLILLAADS
jgi:putative ABC transport system substrate-binding protein